MKKKLKAILLLLVILPLSLMFVACDNSNNSESEQKSNATYCTVTFDSNGGSNVASIKVEKNTNLTEPTSPTKEGYTFDGWYYGEEKWSFIGYTVNQNLTLKAHWKSKIFLTQETNNEITIMGLTEYAKNNNITEIVIPNDINDVKVTNIEFGAFQNCSNLTSITIPFVGATLNGTSNTHFGYIFDASSYSNNSSCVPSSLKTVIITGGNNIENDAFSDCSKLTNVTIPNSVTSIGDYAFCNCSNLTSVIIGNSITHIGDNSLFGCNNLKYNIYDNAKYLGNNKNPYLVLVKAINEDITSCQIHNDTKIIHSSAFKSCSSLTSVTIGSSVISIGNSEFSSCSNLTSLVVDKDNEVYDSRENCNAIIETKTNTLVVGCKNTTIPNSVTSIGDGAFCNCNSLTNVTIGSGVTSIGLSAFNGCNSLTNVYYTGTIEQWCNITFSGYYSNPMYYGKHFYMLDSNKEYKEVTEIEIPNNITEIKNYTFYGFDNLTSATIKNGVTTIGNKAFYKCNSLTSVTIGNDVTSIGDYTFFDCVRLIEVKNLSSLNITLGSWNYGYVGCYAKRIYKAGESYLLTDNDGFVKYNDGKNVYLVDYKGTETEITIPNDITMINGYALYNKDNLISVTISNNVKNIEDDAFYNCSSLTSITIPNSVKSIGDDAFFNCYRLIGIKNLSILNITTGSSNYGYVGYYAKRVYKTGESNLSTDSDGFVKYNDGTNVYLVDYIGTETEITIPSDVTIINGYALYNKINLTNVTISNSITNIEYCAFSNCSNLQYNTYNNANYLGNNENPYLVLVKAINASITSCQIHNDTKIIHSSAFYNCSKLTSITIGNSVTSIESEAFRNCSKLTSVTIPNSVTSIGDVAFAHCNSLTSVTIGNSVISIGSEVFYNCSKLASVTIPNSVTSIGDRAFSGCSSLTSVTFENTSDWKVSEYSSMSNAKSLSSSLLSNTSTVATYLKSIYQKYYWKRG